MAVDMLELPRSGTPSALIRRHQGEIWRYLRYLGCDEAAADDLTQETFLAVLARPPAGWGDSAESNGTESNGTARGNQAAERAYLRTVARNQLLTTVRRRGRGPREVELEAAEAVWSELHAQHGNEYLDALDDCLANLNGQAKKAIELLYREERSRVAIGRELNLSEDGVKSLLRRAREALRDCVERKVRNRE